MSKTKIEWCDYTINPGQRIMPGRLLLLLCPGDVQALQVGTLRYVWT